MTCTTMVPGQPKNFYILNGHLVLINNSGYGKRTSAVVVYSITDAGLTYKTHHVVENQEILDSRLFNDTLVTYAKLFKPQPAGSNSGPKQPIGDIDVADSISSAYYPGGQNTEYIVTSFNQLTEQPKVVFEDILFSQKEESLWNQEFSTADVGRVVSKYTYFKDFISASDRYFVITKEISETYVQRVEQRTSTYRICTNYNPRAEEIRHTYCRPNWKQIDNPGFDKDFSCHSSASFAQCVQENENKFVKSYWQYEGSTCSEHSYGLGRCEAYESKTIVTQSPIFNQRVTSHLMIYKYEQGKFIRFDDPTGALPIAVSGSIKEHKSYQFRSGYLMMVTSDRVKGSALLSYKLAEKALVFAGAVDKMGPGEDLKAVLFTDIEAFIVTFLQKDPLFRIDLNDPARPKLTGKLDVPGFSTQLIHHAGKLIGIGQTAERGSDHVKVSLFEVDAETVMSELDAVSLGTDMDYSHNNSATDDQLHHFVPAANRLYVPYSGWAQRQASDTFSKVCPVGYSYPKHRLSIFQVGARLEEASVLEFRGSIERVLEHQPGKSLAFSTGSVNTISEANGKYASDTVRELYQTEGIYSDPSLPAGMVVAKQVVRSGGQLYKMRFALGTRDQIIKNEPAHVVEISDDLVTCLGNPQIQFFNNELFIGHNLHHYREGYRNPYDRVEMQISGYLGWKISDAGFQPMADAELAAYRDRQPTYCWIKGGVPAPAKWEELVDHESRVGELYDCRVGTMEQAGKIIN